MQPLPCSLQPLGLQFAKCLMFVCILLLLLVLMMFWVVLAGHAAVCCIALLMQGPGSTSTSVLVG
jgi:hypothetical protein